MKFEHEGIYFKYTNSVILEFSGFNADMIVSELGSYCIVVARDDNNDNIVTINHIYNLKDDSNEVKIKLKMVNTKFTVNDIKEWLIDASDRYPIFAIFDNHNIKKILSSEDIDHVFDNIDNNDLQCISISTNKVNELLKYENIDSDDFSEFLIHILNFYNNVFKNSDVVVDTDIDNNLIKNLF